MVRIGIMDWTFDYKDQSESGELEYLDPKKIDFSRRGDALVLTIEGDRSYLKVRAVRAFPLTEPNEFIGFMDSISGRDIGVIRSLCELDCPTRKMIKCDLEKRYFIPRILKIDQAKKEFGTVYWDVDTDRGRRQFVMRGIRDSIHEIEPGRYLVIDIDGNRFEVPRLDELDARSQACWDRLI